MSFVSNFVRFSALQKIENRLRADRVTDSLKVGTFLRHNVGGTNHKCCTHAQIY